MSIQDAAFWHKELDQRLTEVIGLAQKIAEQENTDLDGVCEVILNVIMSLRAPIKLFGIQGTIYLPDTAASLQESLDFLDTLLGKVRSGLGLEPETKE